MIELTDREYAVLRGLASGLSMAQIAARMDRCRATIYRDADDMRAKLGARSIAHLVDRGWRLGILTPLTPLLRDEAPMPTPVRVTEPLELITQRRADLVESLRGGLPRRRAAR